MATNELAHQLPSVCCIVQPVACFMTACAQPLNAVEQDTRTTMMLRNLPNDYTRDMVTELMDSKGLYGRYNFFYLPIDFHTNSGLGYAFVNFVTHADAEQAQFVLQGYADWKIPSHKVLEVSWSGFSQGLESNIERYRNSSVFHPSVPEEFQPLLLDQGIRVQFPKPTKTIQKPRLKTPTNPKGADSKSDELAVRERDNCSDLPVKVSPWDRIKRTISVLNSGDINEILSNARKTLSSGVTFVVPSVTDELQTVSQVCAFHKRLHDAIPDLKLSLETLGFDDKTEGFICWRVTCTGTQVKQLIPHVPIGVRATFTLEVSVKDGANGRPVWISWRFGVAEMTDNAEFGPKELQHITGQCTPCAYFAFRGDGCRVGDDCEFCHLCTKSQAKAKKKAKAKALAKISGEPKVTEVFD